MTIIAALIGFVICLVTVRLGNKVGNRLLRYGLMLVGILLGLGAAGALAPNTEAAGTAGMIMFGLAVVYTLFFGKKEKA